MNSKHTKSKPITTSVPSFAIRFHASGEELEELYPSEEEEKSEKSEKSLTEEKSTESTGALETNKHESSPMRDYLNKFGKRSSSIDAGINETTTLSQQTTSDPWRIFSEFKGKLTKTVEEKLSEIKSKSTDGENSPKLTNKNDKSKTTGGSKENSSVSDSEEQSFSECSIPKSSGLSSTAEDIEMSSDDENSLAESEKTPTENPVVKEFGAESSSSAKKLNLRHRVKVKPFVQFSSSKDIDAEGHVKISALSTVHEKEGTGTEEEVESGVEACEDLASQTLESVTKHEPSTVLVAPSGFVDMRSAELQQNTKNILRSRLFWSILVLLVSFCIIFPLPNFLWGFILGALLATGVCVVYYQLTMNDTDQLPAVRIIKNVDNILEVPAAKEYQPVTKFEGWLNEYPEPYDPRTYHIMRTQSVFLKLEGSVLRVSHTRAKIPKRAMWNEPKHVVTFTHHRLYNLKGSHVVMLPNGLIHKRLWSKKYPICIILNKEKMHMDIHSLKKEEELETDEEQKAKRSSTVIIKDNEVYSDPLSENVDDPIQSDQIDQQTSAAAAEEMKDILADCYSDAALEEDKDEFSISTEDWDTLNIEDANAVETKIYLFARTCRDKEDWYRRLVIATRDSSPERDIEEDSTHVPTPTASEPSEVSSAPAATVSISAAEAGDSNQGHNQNVDANLRVLGEKDDEDDYLRFMARFNQVHQPQKMHDFHPARHIKHKLFHHKKKNNTGEEEEHENNQEVANDSISWMNAFIARVLYDVCKHDNIIGKFQSLIQRKISTIKLPYFIENIVMTDLSLGKSSPSIHNVSGPTLDERGLWIQMHITYEGVISMAIVTKLNLMKLKEQAGRMEEPAVGAPSSDADTTNAKSPIYHSDVEDSAESSSDDETAAWLLASSSAPADASQDSAPGKPNTGSRKFLRMVDKIASSKYFQQATEFKYIKRAMEGVSKTDIKLAVEVQYLEGTLAINIPPPPSDRIWIGFSGNPTLQLSAQPAFGERTISFQHVTRWIEKKLAVEFQKFLVLPNMEDFILPVMIPDLPK